MVMMTLDELCAAIRAGKVGTIVTFLNDEDARMGVTIFFRVKHTLRVWYTTLIEIRRWYRIPTSSLEFDTDSYLTLAE